MHIPPRHRTLAVLLASALAVAPATPARADERAAVTTAYAAGELFALDRTALSIGLVTPKDALSVHVGTLGAGRGAPDDATPYEIGSNTKTFTAALLARAVNERRIALDDDVRNYMPAGYDNLAFEGEPIRVVHLANLTSGLPNWLPDPSQALQNLPQERVADALSALLRNYDRTRFYADLRKVALRERPGTVPRHSNVAAQLLADILERVYGEPYQKILARVVTGPAGMRATGFDVGGTAIQPGHDAQGRIKPLIGDLPDLATAGGLRSTTRDMLAYLRFQLDARNADVQLSHRTTVQTPQDTVALNWHVGKLPSGETTLWHTGGTFGFSSYVLLVPSRGVGVVLLANESDLDTQTRLVAIAEKISSAYLQR